MKAVNLETRVTEQSELSGWLNAFLSQLRRWHRNYRTRRHLAELPPHLWKDLGLEYEQVMAEVNKPFWR
ncbi:MULTISPECIES: DUF1127 domain-containing protein [Vibrio]|uniref:DUF1127 domain-containing protein n=1 Tax=Vibrio ostreae TaxID=2841925 RepID=A0A975YMQ2_9VIBR|nr:MULTISPECIES: DUF1127 domain-containing protein [Vibrio]QXO16864.1 DUF1127 domain-containing protein [Vibrio ostreae]WGY46133.1 DUF1127 domain-containing protein [Vibrio sp. ABG19]